jgi:putative SOS response-associated peptidase YedK
MCNLYTYRLSRDEIRGLMEHYKLIGTQWAEMFDDQVRAQNEPFEVYPNYLAPVVIDRDGKRVVERLRWGMPAPLLPPKKSGAPPLAGRPVTNVRDTRSGHWRPWLASSSVVVGKEQHKGGRCIVPASAFAEPDRNTSNPVIFRWFQRADGLLFFFAGIWREWQGDRGTKKAPDVGLHRLYAFLTTEPNGIVKPIHDKAMPVLLMTAEDVERWLAGTLEEALELQKPADDAAVAVRKEKVAA